MSDHPTGRGRVAKGIEKSELIKRESAILRIIEERPDWHHNRIKKYLVANGLMSGMTFERLIKKLHSEKKILGIKRERMKNRKYYVTAINDPRNENEFKKGASLMVSILENAVQRFTTRYSDLCQLDKIQSAVAIIEVLFSNLNALSLYYILGIHSEKVSKPHEKRFRDLIAKVLGTIRDDPTDKSIYSIVITQILPPLETGNPKNET